MKTPPTPAHPEPRSIVAPTGDGPRATLRAWSIDDDDDDNDGRPKLTGAPPPMSSPAQPPAPDPVRDSVRAMLGVELADGELAEAVASHLVLISHLNATLAKAHFESMTEVLKAFLAYVQPKRALLNALLGFRGGDES